MRPIWTRRRGLSPRDQAFDELTKAAGGGTRLSRRQVFRAAAIVAGVGVAGQIIEIPRATAQSPGPCTPGNYRQCLEDAVVFATDALDQCVKVCGSRGFGKARCAEICLETEAFNYVAYIKTKCDTLSCPEEGFTCDAGICACGGHQACGVGEFCCDDRCTDTEYDHANCGACGNPCEFDQACCKGTCLNTGDDSDNCGRCGNVCLSDVPDCCGGTCVDTSTDPANCGDCGIDCPSRKLRGRGLHRLRLRGLPSRIHLLHRGHRLNMPQP